MSKKRTDIEKRKARSREKKKKKRSLKIAKDKAHQKVQNIFRPGLPHMGAPEGYRSISMSQAIMEYSKPIMEFVKDDEKGMNDAVQAGMLLWNYSLSLEKQEEDKGLKSKLLNILSKSFRLDNEKASALITKMVSRYRYLFPEEIQPKGTPFMFIRKEVRYLIRPFDYNKLRVSEETIPLDQKDRILIDKIRQLDKDIQDRKEWDTYEKLFHSIKEECEERFELWLINKGLKDNPGDYSFCLSTYLDFIYGYMHDDTVVLKSVPEIYFIEFFEDFLIRKMMVEPIEYVYWPPALKLFYQFLHEKNYLDNPNAIIEKIDQIEPDFISVLKKQFA
ncbi:MAG: hypothetical protein JW896_06055 [Deltaproteobacteria bacterium]|nr:hypothetical protein [Deltaproteobacteria bacterium]